MNGSTNGTAVERRPETARRPVPTRRRGIGTFLGWLGRAIPTAIVFAALGGLAYWGHHTGWKLPKFSALIGDEAAQPDDWCPEHNVPESICVECKPELLPRAKDYGWCDEHGVPECPECHPQIAQVRGKPRPPRYDTRAALGLKDRPENDPSCQLHKRRLQFATAEAAAKAGVEIDVVKERPMGEYVAANGEVTFDPTRVARVTTPLKGRVWRVEKQVGDPVRRGELLALVDAPEVGGLKADLLTALAQVDLRSKTAERLRPITGSSVAAQELAETEASLREAQIRRVNAQQALANLGLPVQADGWHKLSAEEVGTRARFAGLPEDLAKTLDPGTTSANLLPLRAPLDGVVVAREAVTGEFVEVTKVLFVVADPAALWLTLHVRQEDLKHLKLKQAVRLSAGGGPFRDAGRIDWISPAVDEKTRTVPVRVAVEKPDGALRNNTFGTGRVVLREEPNAVTVPHAALHWDGTCHIVFVRDKNYLAEDAPKVFHVRKVVPGAKDEKYTELLAGVLPGEVVVAKGSAAMRAELLKSNLGEG